MAGQHAHKDDAVAPHLDHLSKAAIGVIVTDENELPLLHGDTR